MKRTKFFNTRAEGGTTVGATVIVLIMTISLILYVMMIPPADRAALLNDNVLPTQGSGSGSNGGGSSGSSGDIVNEYTFTGPGFVDDADEGTIHRLPAVTLRTRTNSRIFVEDALFQVTQTFTEQDNKLLSFTVPEDDPVDNVYLSFLTKKAKGTLTIELNGNELLKRELEGNVAPIAIPASMLKESNIIEISTTPVGWLFWRTNEFVIEDFKVFGDVTKTSAQTSYTTFELGSSELRFLDRATLDFYPDCNAPSVNTLFIYVNDRLIFDQLPDCKVLNKYDFPKSLLEEGVNSVEFRTSVDSYLIDRIEVETKLKENDDLLYYFDLSDDLFTETFEEQYVCGELDGACPDNCAEDQDRDCCFDEYSGNGFWCDIPTANSNDRCVGRVDSFNVGTCSAGYEDDSGNPHNEFEDLCGDDTDGVCPAGCGLDLDKDCCLSEDSDRFWCDNMPITGAASICVNTVTNDECALCPGGYEGEDYDPSCTFDSRNYVDDESTLKSDYDVETEIRFVDDGQRKRGIVKVNNYEFSFDTFDDRYERDIDSFVDGGTNYIQIIPQNSFNLVSVEIKVVEE
jgi:hypothetical protein